ncbi:hypothetical protein L798_11085 [Zootermopsis nevadensis]|uniref:Uncharacterized protein n=1 Tax=Zootermopsis nevadensis TaxID=136037 RepID=A0A067QXT7_ZOONE|nr:hypothetical protein L798_11085 [Zootermopsis nevadensis]
MLSTLTLHQKTIKETDPRALKWENPRADPDCTPVNENLFWCSTKHHAMQT